MSVLSKMEKSQLEFLMRDNNDSSVAKQFGVTRQAVYAIRKKYNIPSSRHNAPIRISRILDMKRQGTSAANIAHIVNVSQSYVYKVIRNNLEISHGQNGTEPADQDPV